jgi:hypothetical protein
VLDLAGDLAVKRRRVEGLDARNTVAAFEQRLPGVLRGIADRGQQTDAGDYDSAGNNRSPLTRPQWLEIGTGCLPAPPRPVMVCAAEMVSARDYFFLPSM